MIAFLIQIINILANFLIILIVLDTVLSFFLSPYHPIRSAIDRFLNPLLANSTAELGVNQFMFPGIFNLVIGII